MTVRPEEIALTMEKLPAEVTFETWACRLQPEPSPNGSPATWELVIADMRDRDRIGRNAIEERNR